MKYPFSKYQHLSSDSQHNKLMVMSMDVSALYPSIKVEMAKEAIIEAITKSDMEWSDIDMTNIARYIAVTHTREELGALELDEVIPEPMGTTTLNSFVNPKRTAKESQGES